MLRHQGLLSGVGLCARTDVQHGLLRGFGAGFASNAAATGQGESSMGLQELAKSIQERGRDYQQPPDMVEMYDLQTKQLTFGHLPATANFLEGLTMNKSSEEPLQDLAGWAERHHPNFMAKPHGPFYNWVKWMQVHLPQEEQDMYLKLDRIMGKENARSAFLKTAQWELSRLWDWQHHRVAANLPADIPLHQRSTDAAAQLSEAHASLQTTAATEEMMEERPSTVEAGENLPSTTEPAPTPSTLSEMFTQYRPVPIQPPVIEEVDPLLQRIQSMPSWDVRRIARVLQDKRSLGSTIRRMQRRRRIAGNRAFESDLQEASHSHFIGQEVEAAEDVALRPLTVREYTSQVQSGRSWQKTPLLDRSHLLQAALQDFAAEAREREAMKLRPFHLQDDGWQFDLHSRPPTPNFDLLCDYLELKYADAVLMKDFVFLNKQEMSGRHPVQVVQDFIDEQWEQGPFVDAVKAEQAKHIPLSPQEVAAINAHATELLQSDPVSYKQFMAKLKADGLITEHEFGEALRAADVRVYELAVEAQQAHVDHMPVGETEREALLKLLQRGSVEDSAGGGNPEVADMIWQSVTAHAASKVEGMKTLAEQYLQALQSRNINVSEEHKAALLDWWDSPLSLQEASRLWQSYADRAGIPVPPSLHEVLTTAKLTPLPTPSSPSLSSDLPAPTDPQSSTALPETTEMRSPEARDMPSAETRETQETASAAARETRETPSVETAGLTEIPSAETAGLKEIPSTYSADAAAALDERLRELFGAFCARERVESLTWEEAVAANAAAGTESVDGLLGLFPETLTVEETIKQHLQTISDKHKVDKGSEENEEPTVNPDRGNPLHALHRHWQTNIKREITRARRQKRLSSMQGAVDDDTDSDSESGSESDSESDSSSSSSGSEADDESSSSNGESKGAKGADSVKLHSAGGQVVFGDAWERYVQQQARIRAVSPDPLSLETYTAPPYSGASRLLTVEQTLMLHAGAGIYEHPLGRKVRVRVHVGELQEELGLSEDATRLMVEVAGPQYDAETGELGVSCRRHARREENLRWCIETIHKLVDECNKVYPSKDFKPLWQSTV